MAVGLLLAALLLSGAQARILRAHRGDLSMPLQPALQSSEVMESCSNLVSDLWADLVINASEDDPEEDKVNFEKKDKEVKDQWMKDCIVAYDVNEGSEKAVGKVVEDSCAKAGGDNSTCKGQRTSWLKANEEKKLGPWCDATFDWFKHKTKPKCLSKCNAYLCKARCNAQDKVDELSHKIAAYRIKLDTEKARLTRVEKAAEDMKFKFTLIENVNKDAADHWSHEVTALGAKLTTMIKELGVLTAASRTAAEDQKKTSDALLKAIKEGDKKRVSDAQANKDAAAAKYKKARAKQVAKNKDAVKLQGKIAGAVSAQKSKSSKHVSVKREHETLQKKINEEKAAISAKKAKLEKEKDELLKLKATIIADEITIVNTTENNGAAYCSAYCAYNWNNEMPSHFKGACCLNAYNAVTGETMPCTAQTPVPAPPPPPQVLTFDTVGNNGDAYCSAYCAANWNSELPSDWKGACCLKAIAADTGEEIACNAYNSGSGSTCTCQQQDNTPWIAENPSSTAYTCSEAVLHNTVANNGAAYCSAYCGYNWNNELPSSWGGACCAKAYATDDGDWITCNEQSGSTITCTCQESPGTPWLTGDLDATNVNNICSGPVPLPPTPAPPPPPPAPVPRDGLTCECQQQDSSPFLTGTQNPSNVDVVCSGPRRDNIPHRHVQLRTPTTTPTTTTAPTTTPTLAPTTTTTNLNCNCFQCGGNTAFNNADVCGPASNGCGPSSPGNGCWTNRDSSCVCGTHTLVQQCQCFHCGNSDPFPTADVCGAQSSSCGPGSPDNGGCWTNVEASCQCGTSQTTGR